MADEPKNEIDQYLDDLSREDIEALGVQVAGLRKILTTAVDTAVDNKTRRWRNVIIALCVALGLALGGVVGLGLVALQANEDREDLKTLIEAQNSDLIQRRIDACERDNLAREGARLTAMTTAQAFTALAAILVEGEEIDEELAEDLRNFQINVVDPLIALSDIEDGPFAERTCTAEALSVSGA